MNQPYIAILGVIILCVVGVLSLRLYARMKTLKSRDRLNRAATFMTMREYAFSDAELDKLLQMLGKLDLPAKEAAAAAMAGDNARAQSLLDAIPGEPDVLSRLVQAKMKKSVGDVEGARQSAIHILQPSEESRAKIAAWAVLRELGHAPSPKEAGEVLGVVGEFVLGTNAVMVCGYSDGDARLLTSSGFGMIGMMQEQPNISKAAKEFVKAVRPVLGSLSPTDSRPLPEPGKFRVSVLTPAGVYAENAVLSEVTTPDHPLYPVWTAMQNLITSFRLVGNEMGIGV